MKRTIRPVSRRSRRVVFLAVPVVLALASAGIALSQQMLQYGFEARNPVWLQGRHDANYKETLHGLTADHVHNGQRSETIQFVAESGSYIHYTYALGRAPINDDFTASVWVRGTRPGMQLLARVVFPKERDPSDPDHPLTALIPGDRYQLVQNWQVLTVPSPVRLLHEKQQLLSAALKRAIDATDAYVDQMVLNVYSGPGETKVWIDDLEAGPAFDAPGGTGGLPDGSSVPPGSGSTGPLPPGQTALNHRFDEVRLEGGHLKVGNDRLFMLGIRYTGTLLPVLRNAGFNTVWLDDSAPSGLIETAANLGFWIVPTLHVPDLADPSGRVPGQLVSNEAFSRNVSRFLREQSVLCWDLGETLSCEQSPQVIRTAREIHARDPLRPLAADVRDGFGRYAEGGNEQLMVGTHRWPLMTSLELQGYRHWLTQRRMLMPADTFCWTWIQTHLPDWFMTTAYERTTGRFTEPIGPQPEQIRLLSYIALGCGYRGLAYWSDRFLADSHAGRDRLLALALLNQEFRMLEPLLVSVKREPQWIQGLIPSLPGYPDTPNPNVMAAVLECDKAILVLPIWMGGGGQYVPAQGHVARLKLKVPVVPEQYSAWEVSPGRFRSYKSKPVLGGKEITLENFNLTSAIVFTSDMIGRGSLVPRFQEMQRGMRKDAAQWTHDQAQEEIVKAAHVHEELKQMGKRLGDGDALLDTARKWLEQSRKHRLNGEFAEAYNDAQLSLQAVRILMREHWDAAVQRLTTPVACPFAVSFYTLPRFWRYFDELVKLQPGRNLLPEGDFEWPPDQRQPGWTLDEIPSLDEVKGEAMRVANDPREGKQCLMLRLSPKNTLLPPRVLERTFVAIHSPVLHLPAGSTVRISGWVRVPEPIIGSPDGAMLYDSAGGEPLAVRWSLATPWRKFILYRTVPDSGTINVSMALTGLGTVYFDDLRIEPMAEKDASEIVTSSAPPR
jgi:hypothetical protein